MSTGSPSQASWKPPFTFPSTLRAEKLQSWIYTKKILESLLATSLRSSLLSFRYYLFLIFNLSKSYISFLQISAGWTCYEEQEKGWQDFSSSRDQGIIKLK